MLSLALGLEHLDALLLARLVAGFKLEDAALGFLTGELVFQRFHLLEIRQSTGHVLGAAGLLGRGQLGQQLGLQRQALLGAG